MKTFQLKNHCARAVWYLRRARDVAGEAERDATTAVESLPPCAEAFGRTAKASLSLCESLIEIALAELRAAEPNQLGMGTAIEKHDTPPQVLLKGVVQK